VDERKRGKKRQEFGNWHHHHHQPVRDPRDTHPPFPFGAGRAVKAKGGSVKPKPATPRVARARSGVPVCGAGLGTVALCCPDRKPPRLAPAPPRKPSHDLMPRTTHAFFCPPHPPLFVPPACPMHRHRSGPLQAALAAGEGRVTSWRAPGLRSGPRGGAAASDHLAPRGCVPPAERAEWMAPERPRTPPPASWKSKELRRLT
jgi:hypothetical protein